jgi:hypothetical protein
MTVICAECKHFIRRELDDRCRARPLSRDFDYVTGIQGPERYQRCRAHNSDGECSLFEEKG